MICLGNGCSPCAPPLAAILLQGIFTEQLFCGYQSYKKEETLLKSQEESPKHLGKNETFRSKAERKALAAERVL